MLYLSCVCHAFVSGHCCLVVTCWERADLLALVCYVKLCFCYFAMWYPGPGRVAQRVTCLATDVSLTADPGVASSIPARSHTFVEIDHEIISTVILLPSAESFKKGCCQLQAKVCAPSTC